MKKLLFFFLLLVIVLFCLPFFMSDSITVSGEKTINTSVEKVYNQFNNLNKFSKWAPWVNKDSLTDIKLNNEQSGIGARLSWKSENENIGTGSFKITDVEQNKYIIYDLSFEKTKGEQLKVLFDTLSHSQTKITYQYKSEPVSYPFQVLNYFKKTAVDQDFNQALNQLITQLEKVEEQGTNQNKIELTQLDKQQFFGLIQETSLSKEELTIAREESLGMVKSYLVDAQKIKESDLGNPLVYWEKLDIENNQAIFYYGYFIDKKIKEENGMRNILLPKTKTLTVGFSGEESI